MATRTQVATEDFSGTLANWTQLETFYGQAKIVSGKISADSASPQHERKPAIRWAGSGTFTDDQYASIVVSGFTFQSAGYVVGVICRASSRTNTSKDYIGAMVCADSAGPTYTTKIIKIINGVATELHSAKSTWASGDRLELEVVGSTATVLRNGTPLGSSFTQTDADFASAPLSSGKPGVVISTDEPTSSVGDDWIGGNLSDDTPPADTTPPTLTSPTGTKTGTTTASGSVTTDEANGTLYAVVSVSATKPTPTQIQAGQSATGGAAAYATSKTVTATGGQAFSATGLAAGTTYYWHYQQKDAAGNDSTVATSAGFTTDATNTPPTFNGTIANISGTQGVALTNVDVAARFTDTDALTYSKIGTWPAGVTLTGSVIGGTPTVSGTFASLKVRATDTASQWVESNAFTITLAAAPSGSTITTEKLKNNTGTVLGSTTIPKVAALKLSDMTRAAVWTSKTTEATGELILADAALVPGTAYLVVTSNADGSAAGVRIYTATA